MLACEQYRNRFEELKRKVKYKKNCSNIETNKD